MKRAILLLSLAGVASADELKPPLATVELADGDSIVFLGDSITHQCLYTQYVEDYLFTRYPGWTIHCHNAGVGGDRCADALERFDADVAVHKPKYVTVLLGMNDGGYQPFDQGTFDAYEKGITELLARIEAIGAKPILMTPTMFDSRAARLRKSNNERRDHYYNSVLAYYGALLRELATDRGFGFVDMYSPLNELTLRRREREPAYTLIADAVHPDAPGQVVMAVALLEGIGASKRVWSASVDLGPGGYPKLDLDGGKPIMIEGDARRLSFSFRADSLPWVLPPDAEPGVKLTKAGHRFGRETIQVVGLAPGEYELKVDGASVGEYGHADLADGIELQDNPKTPQYRQALEVARLNQKRNQEAVAPIRNLWAARKVHRHLENAVKNSPNDGKLAQRLRDTGEQIKDFDQKLAALETKSNEMLAAIRKQDDPKPHRFDLVSKGPSAPKANGP